MRAARPACQIQPSGSPNPGGSRSICQSWEMPPPDAPPGLPPCCRGGWGGVGTIWSPLTPPPQDGGRGWRGPRAAPGAGASSWVPDVQPGCTAPGAAPRQETAPPATPARWERGGGDTGPAAGPCTRSHPQQDGGARAKSQPWAQDGDGAQRGAWHRARSPHGATVTPWHRAQGGKLWVLPLGTAAGTGRDLSSGTPRDVKGTRWPRVPDHSACQGAAGCCGHPSSATSVCWPGMSPGSAR